MDKKTVLITGATGGIGLETVRLLLREGFFVLGTYRNEDKKNQALADLKASIPNLNDNLIFIKADLSSRKSLETLADQVQDALEGGGLNVLINNGGTFFSRFTRSEDGIEMQMAVNTLAPLYLSWLLTETLKKAKGRIINVSSSSHYGARKILWDDLQLEHHYSQLRSYRQTKLFSLMLSLHWNTQVPGVGVYMADPGLVKTDMGYKNTGALARFVWKYRLILKRALTPEQGAATTVKLALFETAPSLPDEFYWKYSKPKEPSPKAQNSADNLRLWEYACGILGIPSNLS